MDDRDVFSQVIRDAKGHASEEEISCLDSELTQLAEVLVDCLIYQNRRED